MTYYAMRWSLDSDGKTLENDRTGTKPEMERQYHLYCANSATNTDHHKFDSCEWGTFEGGKLERKTWNHEAQE